MKERPILFNSPMVRAVLSGAKTQTRRLVKPQPPKGIDELHGGELSLRAPYDTECGETGHKVGYGFQDDDDRYYHCPYGKPGDRLWVRESFYVAEPYSWGRDASDEEIVPRGVQRGPVHYAADGLPANTPNRHYPNGLQGGAIAAPDPHAIWISRPSIHMPRWASRITLEITDVRVQLVNEISFSDCLAEGIEQASSVQYGSYQLDTQEDFRKLWCSIYGPDSWTQWCWAITFKRIDT